MSVDSEPADLEQGEEVEVEEEVDAPAHHPYAPPDEVTITFHHCLFFHLLSYYLIVLYCLTIYIYIYMENSYSNKAR